MCASQGVAFYGTGAYVPERVLTNADFTRTLDTSDEWITTRTGIKERRIAAPEETTTDLCLKAARSALENAGLQAQDLDLIVVCTISGDYPFPSSACILQNKLGLGEKGIPAFDVAAACSGFGYGVSTAQAFIKSGMARHVLVVGSEILSRIVDYTDRGSCILFGDGAGAVVMGPCREKGPSHRLLSSGIFADGRGAALLKIPAGGSVKPASRETVDQKQHFVTLDGREIFRFGVTIVVDQIQRAMEQHGLTAKDIGGIIPHQANIRIIDAAAERLALPKELFLGNIHKYGNTSSASVPIVLDEFNRAGRLPKGKPVIMVAFGAGLTWSTLVVEW